jgi:hypothetical protein
MALTRIALSGKCYAGKTTIARNLVALATSFGYRGHNIVIASWIKLLSLRGLGRMDREALQLFGTEVVRHGVIKYFSVDTFWPRLALADMCDLAQQGYNFFVVEDVRELCDLQYMRENGFLIVRLRTTYEHQQQRSNDPNKGSLAPELANHSTETALDKYEGTSLFDLEFLPDHTVEYITNKLSEIIFSDITFPDIAAGFIDKLFFDAKDSL